MSNEVDKLLKEMRELAEDIDVEHSPIPGARGDTTTCDVARCLRRAANAIAWQRQKYERLAENYYVAEDMPDYDAQLAVKLKGE